MIPEGVERRRFVDLSGKNWSLKNREHTPTVPWKAHPPRPLGVNANL